MNNKISPWATRRLLEGVVPLAGNECPSHRAVRIWFFEFFWCCGDEIISWPLPEFKDMHVSFSRIFIPEKGLWIPQFEIAQQKISKRRFLDTLTKK